MRFIVERTDGFVEIALLPYKDGSGYSFINITKGHICSCKFPTVDDAMNDLRNQPEVKKFEEVHERRKTV